MLLHGLAADGAFAKVPVGHFPGQVGTHQHRHGQIAIQKFRNHVRDETDAATGHDLEA